MPGIGAERVLPCAAVLRNRKRFDLRQAERTKREPGFMDHRETATGREARSSHSANHRVFAGSPFDPRRTAAQTPDGKAKQMGDEAGRPADRDAWRGGRVPRLPTTPSRLNQTKGTGRTGHTARDKRARHRTMIG